MQTQLNYSFKILAVVACILFIFTSCKKETGQLTPTKSGNRPPLANAGVDQIITLPNNVVTLDGSGSTDPDNNITGYVWAKISGPPTFNIVNANTVQTQVKDLTQGAYQFELTVTDDKGASAKDTVQVTVNSTTVTNKPPIANAGVDQSFSFLCNNRMLN